MSDFLYIKRNYEELCDEISTLAERCGTKSPTLVCVTKSGSDEELVALMKSGATHIGENRPGEVLRRYELLRSLGYSPLMHEIGTLQRNKIKLVAPVTAMIHSVDSLHLAKDISRHAEARGRVIPVLIEVNSGEEEQKSGVLPDDAERLLCEIKELPGISVSGLMTMGPAVSDAELLRGYFRQTRALFDKLSTCFGNAPTLSMGMSGSYRVAIEEGSTLVRVGTKLFVK